MKKIILSIIIVLILQGKSVASESKGMIEQGKDVYNKNCWFCHGQKGDGNSDARAVLKYKPRNFTDPKVIENLTISRMIKSITNGREGTAMPSFRGTISTAEIRSVSLYIKNVIMKKNITERAYEPHSEGFTYLEFDKINEKSDIKICLLHCHTDESFIRSKLKEFKNKK